MEKLIITSSKLWLARVDALVVVSTTGVSAPSLDAFLLNRLPFRGNLKRLPVFGLGCAGGVGSRRQTLLLMPTTSFWPTRDAQACAEVSVDEQGKLRVHRIVAATDPGYAVNPQQIEAQIEGSFVFGLSALLYGECTIKNGGVEQDNFSNYPSMLISEMPKVDVIVMPSGGFWGGIGEPTIAVAAPAVLNAIFAATGKRIRTIPLKHADLSPA